MEIHLYPSRLSQRRALEEAVSRREVVLGEPHLTYPDLFERLYLELRLGPPPVGSFARQIFLHRAVAETRIEPSDGNPKEKPARHPGLVAEFGEAIAELKRAALLPDDLRETWQGLGGSDLVEAEEIRLLEKVYRAYQELLDRLGAVDEEERDLRLLSYLQKNLSRISEIPSLKGVERLALHNLYHLSLVDHGILSCLIRSLPAGAILVYFTRSENVTATQFAERTWQRFVEDEALADAALPEFAMARRRRGNLDDVQQRLFLFPDRPDPIREEDGSVAIWSAAGRDREVEEIGREIRRLLDRGTRPERIAVLIRNLDRYAEQVEEIARRFRIPIALRRQTPLYHLPIVKWVFSLLELPAAGFERPAFLKVLASGYLSWEHGKAAEAAGLLHGSDYLRPELKPIEASLPPDDPLASEIGERASEIRKRLDALSRTAGPFRTFVAEAAALIEELGVLKALVPNASTPLFLLERDRRGLEALFEVLEETARTFDRLGDKALRYADFLGFASQEVAAETLPDRTVSNGAVAVLGVGDALGLTFDVVFLPGLVDTEFPTIARENLVLSDRAKRHLNRSARAVLPERYAGVLERGVVGRALLLAQDRAREEPLRLFLGLEAAEVRCVLTCTSQGAGGEPLKPSLFVDEITRHFERGGQIVRKIPPLPLAPSLDEALDAGDLLRGIALLWREEGLKESRAEKAFPFLEKELKRMKEAVKVARARLDRSDGNRTESALAAYWGDLSGMADDFLRTLAGAGTGGSPTRMEEIAACPFAFFARQVLSLAPRETRGEDPSTLLLGKLVHEIIQAYLKTEIGGDREREKGKIAALVDRFETVSRDGVRPVDFGYWAIRRPEILQVLTAFVDAHLDALSRAERLLGVEVRLEGEIATAGRSHPIRGRVDLIYVREEPDGIALLRIEDLKYSKNPGRYKKYLREGILGEASFQLPVYAYLALEKLRNEGRRFSPRFKIEGQYTLLKHHGAQPKIETLRDEITDRKEKLFAGIDRLIEKVERGKFSPDPHEGLEPCGYCDYGPLCRYPWTAAEKITETEET
jgi:superfamily I DNA/RNA helicase